MHMFIASLLLKADGKINSFLSYGSSAVVDLTAGEHFSLRSRDLLTKNDRKALALPRGSPEGDWRLKGFESVMGSGAKANCCKTKFFAACN